MSVLPDPGASRAVLIGTSRYEHLEQLPAVSNNLTALAGLLSGPLSLRMPAPNVTVVENPRDSSTVLDPLRQAAAEATDTLLVYYAGHGLIDSHDALALAMPHTQPGRIETSLNYDWLREILLGSRAQRHVVLLDCCYSGLALGRMSASQALADHAAVEGTFLLAASAETRTALAPVGDTHTAFTGALLDTLRHGIPGGPPLLDLETVYQHLRRTLKARAHPAPQARNRNSGARVALGRNQADLPAAPVTAAAGPEQPDQRLWPDPSAISTVTGFFTNLAAVREVSGLTQQEVSRRSAGRISTGTISKLVNRDTLPATWTTTAAYLSACGVPDDQIQQWHSAWQEMRRNASATEEPRTGTPGGGTAEAGKARRRLSALWRGRGH
ncbi:caspase family protein [Streptomyces sp. NBC_01318]|uniref:caspase, EACC1-associated type n=1 Tax=Streptomyces sp. NBC_01318 TaxID=2903823 RepID=UPI002E16559F|nr:caspase family protein [Streptomyces sp. NBC_01318]WSJ55935.1 caspase family protein [Streptomyces sp. NBC_01318]